MKKEAKDLLNSVKEELKELSWDSPGAKLRSLLWRANIQIAKAHGRPRLAMFQLGQAAGSIITHWWKAPSQSDRERLGLAVTRVASVYTDLATEAFEKPKKLPL